MAALALLMILVAVARLRTWSEPLDIDDSAYSVIAHELLQGRHLYADMWDHKPPAIHATYVVAQLIAGYGPGSLYLSWVTASLLTLLGVFAAAVAAGFGTGTGLLAAAFWAIVCGDLSLEANQPNTEVFMNACLVWAFALLLREQPDRRRRLCMIAIAGILFALATLYKTIAIVYPLSVAAVFVISRRGGAPWRDVLVQVLILGTGGVVLWGAVFAWFLATGAFGAFWDAVIVWNRFYAGNVWTNLLEAFLPTHLLPRHLVPVLPMIALAAIGTGLAFRRGWSYPKLIAIAWLIATPLAIGLPGRYYPHYYQLWLPPLCVGAAWGVVMIRRAVRKNLAWVPRIVGIAALVSLVLIQVPNYLLSADDWSRAKYGPDFVQNRATGRAIARLLRPGELFYVWGTTPELYYASRLSPPAGVFYVVPLLWGPDTAALSRRVVNDLSRTLPELLVVDARDVAFPPGHTVVDWFTSRYVPWPGADPESPRYRFFYRKGGALETRIRNNLE